MLKYTSFFAFKYFMCFVLSAIDVRKCFIIVIEL